MVSPIRPSFAAKPASRSELVTWTNARLIQHILQHAGPQNILLLQEAQISRLRRHQSFSAADGAAIFFPKPHTIRTIIHRSRLLSFFLFYTFLPPLGRKKACRKTKILRQAFLRTFYSALKFCLRRALRIAMASTGAMIMATAALKQVAGSLATTVASAAAGSRPWTSRPE